MAASNHSNFLKRQLLFWKRKVLKRNYAKFKKEQDPEEVRNMPIFQYATENTKRSNRIYLWGSAFSGALGNSNFLLPKHPKSILRTMHKPWRHPFTDKHKVRDIACGYGFTVIAGSNENTDYSLFATGLNSDGQIGYHCNRHGRPLEVISEPVPILLPLLHSNTKAVLVACGRAHTIVVTDKEGVFSLGNNAYGQCGTPYYSPEVKEHSIIHKVEGIDEDITKVVCGQDHTLFVSKSGTVYSCGWGADGQTGLGHYKNLRIPSKVVGDIEGEKIVKISCAADCVLALSDKGEVFGWGNSEYKQLNSVTDKQQINVSKHLNLNLGKIKDVASGGTMCSVLTDEGLVYVWGYGILGQGPKVTSLAEPTLLPPPLFGYNEFSTDNIVEQLGCSLSHFAAVTSLGHLYMWGRNRNHCLGLGRPDDQFFPFRVAVPAEVRKVCCGVDHTGVICKSFT